MDEEILPVEQEVQPTSEGDSGPSVPLVGDKAPPTWALKRIDTLTGRNKDLMRERDDYKRVAEEYQAKLTGPAETKAAPPVETIKAEIEAKLRFEASANRVLEDGRKTYQDFNEKLGNFAHIGAVDPSAVAAAFDTGAGHRVLYALAEDLDEAQRIFSLSPTKMAIEMERIAARTAQTPEAVSKAPRPIKPIGARASAATDALREDDDIESWMRKRNEQVQRKRR